MKLKSAQKIKSLEYTVQELMEMESVTALDIASNHPDMGVGAAFVTIDTNGLQFMDRVCFQIPRNSLEPVISMALGITQFYCFQGWGPLFCCLFYCFLSQSEKTL